MAIYLIGDIQGCYASFKKLLTEISFSPSRDTIYLLGDLVNRGPDSSNVLRTCMKFEGPIKALLGNHDLHLLASAYGFKKNKKKETLEDILSAPDCDSLIKWVAQQPLAYAITDLHHQKILLVHAGVLPAWSTDETLALAHEVQDNLQSENIFNFLAAMYGNHPDHWSPFHTGTDRLRVITNALTRIRFCTPDGIMNFESSDSAESAPQGLVPWFDCPERKTAKDIIAFGHWSTLGLINRPNLIALDTGCVWGGCLTAMELGNNFNDRYIHQISCA